MAPLSYRSTLCFPTAFSPTYTRLSSRIVFTHSHAHWCTMLSISSRKWKLHPSSDVISVPGPLYPPAIAAGTPRRRPPFFYKVYISFNLSRNLFTLLSAAAGKTPVSDLSRLVCREEIAAGNCRTTKATLAHGFVGEAAARLPRQTRLSSEAFIPSHVCVSWTPGWVAFFSIQRFLGVFFYTNSNCKKLRKVIRWPLASQSE